MRVVYTPEQLNWIKENYSSFNSVKEATNAFNEKFSTNRTESAIISKAKRLGCKKLGCFYTTEQIDWIKDNHNNYETRQDLVNSFNLKFSENKTARAMQFQCSSLGLVEMFGHIYTTDEDEWLQNNFQSYTWKELSERFNKRFKAESTASSLRNHCKDTLNLVREDSHFVIRNKKYEVGDERVYGEYTYVKVKEYEKNGTRWTNKKAQECWDTKQRVVWEKHMGVKVPEDCQIVFLNSDKSDFRIENLYCIKKKYLVYMIRNKWFSDNPDITLTAIKWCELMYATRE